MLAYQCTHLDQVVGEPEDAAHVEKTLEQVQRSAVHPALVQHRLELLAEGRMDGVFGRKQVAVRNGFLALHWGTQCRACLLEDVSAHVFHDGTHDNDTN